MRRVVLLAAACGACASVPGQTLLYAHGEKLDYLVQADGAQTLLWIHGGIPAGGAIIVEAM